MSGPLTGYTVIELAGIGPGPYAGQLLADLGAQVILIDRPGADIPAISNRGKKSIVLDLRKEGAAGILLKLVETADVLIEGLRPGVTERLGIGPESCHAVNPKLVYGRMTGWGQNGPWAKVAGHDINYISITGALHAMGVDGEPPAPPLNVVGDFGGGSMFLVMGVLSALLQAEKTGKGDIVDAAMIDGATSLITMIYSLAGLGMWSTKRQSNLVDGGMPYYRCYKTSDDKFMAVGCIEPQFFALMLEKLEITQEAYGGQNDRKAFPEQHAMLEAIYKSKTRDEWAKIFDGSDACVSPVLDYEEAVDHPQNVARGGLKTYGPFIHPRSAPVFQSNPDDGPFSVPAKGSGVHDVLIANGFSEDEIASFIANAVVHAKD